MIQPTIGRVVNGQCRSFTSVRLVQDGDVIPGGAYCEWIPFQKGQAAKYEALEKRIDPGAAA
jgi:hypothetical protein